MKGKRVLKKQIKPNQGLLSTYFISLLSVVLCFVMLFGTTFAWFYTDNTSVGNEIHSGTLKVDMLHVIRGDDKISLAEQGGHPVFSSDHLWTPGRTQTEVVEVVNAGNVTLDYKLDFVPPPDQKGTTNIADWFTVYVNGEADETLNEPNKTLAEIIDKEQTVYLAQGVELGPGEVHSISITLKMDEAVSYSVMGQSLPVFLKLEAYQHLGSMS